MNNELINTFLPAGNCLDQMKLIEDNSIDLIFADLPYGTTQCAWDIVIPLDPLWSQYKRISKPNTAILLFAQCPFDKILGASNTSMLRYEWIWEKTSATGHLNARKMPMKAHENILVFYDKLPVYNPQKTTGHKPVNTHTSTIHTQNKSSVYGKATKEISGGGETDRYPRSVLLFPSDKQRVNLNPTQKPLSLVEYMIKTYTNPGAVVLDNCAGSFTTAVGCENTGRNWISMELNEDQHRKGMNRVLENRARLLSL